MWTFRLRDYFKMFAFALTNGRERELEYKVDLYASTIDRVVAERDAAMTENTRLASELAKALLELANERRRMAGSLAPSLKQGAVS